MRFKLARPQRPRLPSRQFGKQVDPLAFNQLLEHLEGGHVGADDFNNLLDVLQRYALFHSQLAQAGVELAFGFASVTWPGATVLSNVLTVAHKLAKAPLIALAVPRSIAGNGGGSVCASVDTFTAAGFDVILRDVDKAGVANGANGDFYWIAVG